jgi:hypothetical protein
MQTLLTCVAVALAMLPKIAAGAELELTDLVRIYWADQCDRITVRF